MAVRYSYTATDVPQIAKTLSKVFADMEQEGQVTRFATNNLIITACSDKSVNEIEEFVDLLSVVHPSRFFVIKTEPGSTNISAEVSARCQMIGKKEHVCSEVVRIRAGAGDLAAIPSILFANLVTGVPTELFVYDPETPRALVDSLSQVCETVYFDSGDFENRTEVVHHFAGLRALLVDLQWVKMAVWRDQIKNTFDESGIRDISPLLQQVTIRTSGSQSNPATSASTKLLAGWILSRLGLDVRIGPKGFVGLKRDGGEISFQFEYVNGERKSELQEVVLDFKIPGGKKGCVRFVRGKSLETFVELERTSKHVTPLEVEDKLSCMKRYFTIGESIANYPSALKRALVLERLSQNIR